MTKSLDAKTKQLACKDCGTPMIAPTTNRKRCHDCQWHYTARMKSQRERNKRAARGAKPRGLGQLQ